MKRTLINDLHLWQFEGLAKEDSIEHFVTDRYSVAPSSRGKEFTLSFSSSPDKNEIRENRHRLAAALGIEDHDLRFPSQVHKTRIVHVTRQTPKDDLMETDALITNQKGICISVMSADCVPILLFDKQNKVVAAVHSGWRGTVAKILALTLNEMKTVYNTKGEHVIAAIGPSVSQDSYEVGTEVVEAVVDAFGTGNELMISQPNQKAKLDLWKANKVQLLDFGVDPTRIEISNLCTVKNNTNFFSARKGDAGRFAAGIMLVAV
jgi:polyphenol oxidase